jgi:hypothetical protein
MTGPMRAWLLAVALLVGCATAPNRGENLLESVRTYHEGVRWERFPAAASRVPPAERDDFIEERDRLAEDLKISDYEVVRVTAGENDAKVQVKYTWYLDSEGSVRHTHAIEGWERRGKVWVIVEERHLRGDEMPGLPGPEPEGADAGPSEAPGEAPDGDRGPAATDEAPRP